MEYDLTALSDEAAADLARFAAHYPQYLRHWEQAIADATSTPAVLRTAAPTLDPGLRNRSCRRRTRPVHDRPFEPDPRRFPGPPPAAPHRGRGRRAHRAPVPLRAALQRGDRSVKPWPGARSPTSRSAGNSAAARRASEFYDEEGHVLYGRLAASPAFRQGLDRVLAGAQTVPHRPALQRGEPVPVPPPSAHRAGSAGARRGGIPHQGRRAPGDRGGSGGPGGRRRPAARDWPPGHPLRRQHGSGRRREPGFGDRSAQESQWRSPRPISRRKPPPG